MRVPLNDVTENDTSIAFCVVALRQAGMDYQKIADTYGETPAQIAQRLKRLASAMQRDARNGPFRPLSPSRGG